MKRTFIECSTRKPGITLIEVLAATVLMGGILAVTLIASASHLRQSQFARSRSEASVVLDRFTAQWSKSAFDPNELARTARRSGVSLETEANLLSGQRRVGVEPLFRIAVEGPNGSDLPGASMWRISIHDAVRSRELSWVEVIARSRH
jgi:hypothetical protein